MLHISYAHIGGANLENNTRYKQKHMSDVYMSKSQSFNHLKLIFWKISIVSYTYKTIGHNYVIISTKL